MKWRGNGQDYWLQSPLVSLAPRLPLPSPLGLILCWLGKHAKGEAGSYTAEGFKKRCPRCKRLLS